MTIATISTTTTQTARKARSLGDLRGRLVGEIVTEEMAGYDDVRQVSVVGVGGRPLAIVRAVTEGDIAETVRFARETGRPLAVRSGGHSVAGHNMIDGAVVVDMSHMRAVSIDPERRVARVQAGARSGDVVGPAHAYGLALSTGDTASVGLGGLVTGGGVGFMARKHGLAIDNLLSARVVTADGSLVTASASENADLFWAIRGGGGNFGIVTEFEFQLARVGQVLGGALVLPATAEVVRRYLELSAAAPDELTTIANLMHAPPAPFVPAERVGELVLMVLACWTGDIDDGQRALAPFRELAEPVADAIAPIPYPVMYQFTAAQEAPHGVAIRSMFADAHGDETIAAMISAMQATTSPLCMVQFRAMGGAVSRIGDSETAFGHRQRRYFTTVLGLWEPGDEPDRHWHWANELWAAIQGDAAGVYVNFLADEGEGRIRDAYPGGTYERLASVKRAYDPENVFRFNQNIKP